MKTVETLKAPWNVVESISLGMFTSALVLALMDGHVRHRVWPLFVVAAITWSAVRVFRWHATKEERLRQRYLRTVEYSPLFEWLKVFGVIAVIGFWYLFGTTFLIV